MRRLTAIALTATLPLVAACGKKEQAWIVLEFAMSDGKPLQMSFNNPEAADITLADCQAVLPQVQASLVEAAKAKEPMLLKDAVFVSAKCAMSATDPIEPNS